MKFSAATVIASLAAAANAKVAFTNSDFDMTPGSTFTLTWTGNSGDVTIVLATGESTALTTVETIDSDDSGSSFTWTVPTTLTTGLYAFEITDSETTNYSVQFSITGTGSSASSSAVTASSTAAASSAAASSATTSGATTSSATTSSASSASAESTASSATASSSAAASSAAASSSAPASSAAESSSVSTSTGSTSSHSTTKTSSSNTTLSTSSKTSTTSSSTSATSTATATGTSTPANTNNGIKEKSPLAFILVTVATLMYFN